MVSVVDLGTMLMCKFMFRMCILCPGHVVGLLCGGMVWYIIVWYGLV